MLLRVPTWRAVIREAFNNDYRGVVSTTEPVRVVRD